MREVRRLHLLDPEDRRVLDELQRRVPRRRADAALRLLVLERARHAGAPADAAVGADHVRHRRAGLHRGEHVGPRDQVRDLVAAPRVPLDADPLRIDEALRDDGVDRGDDALLGALARIAGVVDDVGHQHDVAVADVAGDVDARARARRAVAVQPLRQLLVDVDHQRVLLRRVEVLGLGEDRAQLLAVGVAVLHQLGLAPDVARPAAGWRSRPSSCRGSWCRSPTDPGTRRSATCVKTSAIGVLRLDDRAERLVGTITIFSGARRAAVSATR